MKIAPSILAADFAELAADIGRVEAEADLLHVDCMDAHYVPNLSIGPPVVKSLHRVATVPLDVHLMIEEPDRYIDAFVEAGAAMISVHVEVLPHLHRTVHAIKALGAKAGVVLNPATPVGAIQDIAADVDYVLVMSVNPGFGGQSFIPRSESKVREVRAALDRAGNTAAPIEIDGGIDLNTAPRVVAAGARILVAGQAIFLRRCCRSEIGVDRFLPQTEADKNVRGHVQSVRRVWRDFRVAAGCIERERSQSRVVIAMDDVMGEAGMLGMFCKKWFENGAGFPLICVGLVT